MTVAELERVLETRKLRMRAFRVNHLWKVLFSSDETGESYAGTDLRLDAAIQLAIEYCDSKNRRGR